MRSRSDSDARLIGIVEARKRSDADYLIAALTDPDHRVLAARYLGELGGPNAVGPLLRLLDADDPTVRAVGARALARLRATEALPRLAELSGVDGSRVVRSWALTSLGAIGGAQALPLLEAGLRDPEWFVRRAAVHALGELDQGDALRLLEVAARRETFVRRRVIRKTIRDLKAKLAFSKSESLPAESGPIGGTPGTP